MSSLYDKITLEKECSKVLGVLRANVKSIKIKNLTKVTDKEIERKVKMYISHILGDKKRSIVVRVQKK